MGIGIKLGHDQEATDARGKLVLDVISAPTGDNVKIAALDALTKMLEIKDVTIRDCSFACDTVHHHHPKPDQPDEGHDPDFAEVE